MGTGGWRRLGGNGDDRPFAQWAKQYDGRTRLMDDASMHHGREGIDRQEQLEALFKERLEKHPDRARMQAFMEGGREDDEHIAEQCKSLQQACVREVFQGDRSSYHTWCKQYPG